MVIYTKTKVVKVKPEILKANRIELIYDNSEFLETYRMLKLQISRKAPRDKSNVLMITSAVKGEGKTVTAINLALAMIKDFDQAVLLVDGNIKSPFIDRYFGLKNLKGFSDYLLENVSISKLLINPGIDKLVLLPGGTPLNNATELMDTSKMKDIVTEFKKRYANRYVIFDSPPVLEDTSSIILSKHVDGVVLVVEAGKTPKDKILKAIELIGKDRITGTVLNKAHGNA